MNHVEKFNLLKNTCFEALYNEVNHLRATAENEYDRPMVAVHNTGFEEYWDFNPAMQRAIDTVLDRLQRTTKTQALPEGFEVAA